MRLVLILAAAASAALALGVGTAAPGTLATCKPTESDGAGPFSRSAAAPPRRTIFGRGHVLTGRDGTFRFQGPKPASEGGFPPHIHVHVSAGGYEDVVTTYFVRAGAKSGRIRIVLFSAL